MPVSIVDLGNSLRCPRKDCDKFGKITKSSLADKKMVIELICEQHMKKYVRKFSVNQYIRLTANAQPCGG